MGSKDTTSKAEEKGQSKLIDSNNQLSLEMWIVIILFKKFLDIWLKENI